MTGGVRLEFAATTINEAVMAATERWRALTEDPEGSLPWSTHYDFYEEHLDVGGGRMAVKSMCSVTIEFDRKVIDELTGVPASAAGAKTV